MYPCVGCLWKKSERFTASHPLRKLSENTRDANSYSVCVSGKSKSFCQRKYRQYHNCIREPLYGLDEPPDTLVLDIYGISPLHIKLRVVNKNVTDFQTNIPETAVAFLSELRVEREKYHGEFQGRECSIIARSYHVLRRIIEAECRARLAFPLNGSLTKRQRLLSIAELESLVQQHPATAYASLFESVDGIMHFCYGADLKEDYRHCFEEFRNAVDTIGCSVTPSMHMMGHHMEQFCDKNGCGLLIYSEETAEGSHHEVTNFFERYKVPLVGRPRHGEFLLRMMTGLNAAHFFA